MKRALQPLVSLVMKLTDYERLSHTTRLVILLHLFFSFANSLSSIFINVYLWKIEYNLWHVATFNFFQATAFFILVPIVGKQLKRQSPTFGIAIGSLCLTFLYCSLLLLQSNSISYLPYLGLLQGIGYLYYWTSFHFLSISLTHADERNLFNGYNEVSQALSALISPIIAGGLIVTQTNNFGYFLIFLCSCLLFTITTLISTFIKIKPATQRTLALRPILQDSINPKKKWFWGSQMIFMQGFSDGLLLFLPSFVYYLFFHNEWNLGLITSVLSALALLSAFVVGRFLSRSKRNDVIGLATTVQSITVLAFFILPSWMTVILFGLGNAIAKQWYFIPTLSTIYDFIDQQPSEHYIEYLISREFYLGMGRMCSFALLFALITQFANPIEVLTWLGLISAIGLPYIWLTVRKFAPYTK